MKILLSVLSLLSLITVTWLLLSLSPDSASSAALADSQTESHGSAPDHSSEGLLPSAAIATSNLSKLPTEQREEIQALSSRDNRDLVVEQVGPNLFKAELTGVHQVVPVATLNDDGTVAITEY